VVSGRNQSVLEGGIIVSDSWGSWGNGRGRVMRKRRGRKLYPIWLTRIEMMNVP
jgi:hypothetical protein